MNLLTHPFLFLLGLCGSITTFSSWMMQSFLAYSNYDRYPRSWVHDASLILSFFLGSFINSPRASLTGNRRSNPNDPNFWLRPHLLPPRPHALHAPPIPYSTPPLPTIHPLPRPPWPTPLPRNPLHPHFHSTDLPPRPTNHFHPSPLPPRLDPPMVALQPKPNLSSLSDARHLSRQHPRYRPSLNHLPPPTSAPCRIHQPDSMPGATEYRRWVVRVSIDGIDVRRRARRASG